MQKPGTLTTQKYPALPILDVVCCRGDAEAKPDYQAVASAVFSNPPLCVVGLSEEEAAEQLGNVDVFTSSFRYS